MKNLFFTLATIFTFFFATAAPLSAQGLVDGFFAPKGEASVTAGYTRGTADAFYVGESRTEGIPAHNEFTQNIYSLYAKYGITDRLTVVGSYAFIDLNGDGAPDPINGLTEDADFQDLQVALKYQLVSVDLGGGSQLDFLVATTGTLAGGYQNNGILSIGTGANAVDFSGGVHFSHSSGFFASAVTGYSLRGEAENTTETNMGADFDVPNAIVGMAKIGYGRKFYGELFFDYQSSQGGLDIGPDLAGRFPETQVNFARVGASAYYPVTPNLGFSLGYSTFIDGRNATDFSYISTGVTVSFGGK